MALKIMDLFKSIKWAKNGAVTDISQTNYEAGWSHLGDDTPTVEDFNIVQQLNDEKDQWLFNQIKAVCDAKGITVTESDVQALLKAINTSATLSRAGITQLSSAIDSTIENMAATPKAIKTLKDLIDAITRNLGNYIPNSKKSNAVDSNSADTVATSVAVKTVNDNANGRVSKAGDTMTGLLNIKNGDYAAVRTYNTAGWSARWESAPQSANHFAAIIQANNNESVVNRVLVPKKNGTILLDSDGSVSGDASTYVKRDGSGDVNARLLRATYPDEGRLHGAIAFRINNSNDNFTRYCNSPAAVRGWLGVNVQNIVVLQGVINHGGTIPLPSGFSEAQCRWMVTPHTIYDDVSSSDIMYFECHAQGTRVVTCLVEGKVSQKSKANYIIIGIK